MKIELERGDDADGSAPAGRPEQVCVLVRSSRHAFALAGDDVDRSEVVGREAVFRREIARPAAEREAGDAGVREDPAGRREAERLGRAVDRSPRCTGTDACRPVVGIDAHPLHSGAVNDECAGGDRRTRDAVAAASDRDVDVVLASERDARSHVGSALAVRDGRGILVHHPVPDAARRRVSVVRRRDERPVESRGKLIERERGGDRSRLSVRVHIGSKKWRGLPLGADAAASETAA